MVNFAHLLSQPAGKSKRPTALPVGDYPGIIKSYEIGDNNKNKTPYVQFAIGLIGWPDGIEEQDIMQEVEEGKFEPIDLSKRQLRKQFFLTETSRWRLDEFLKTCALEMEDVSYQEIFPQLVGQHVLVEVQQYINQKADDGSTGNQVGKLVGQT
jgi:hypothetical protein